MKRMLINATQEEELRMALVDGQRLYDLNIEVPSQARKKANIYKGKITRIEPSLEAAFVDYGAERHGFLPFKDISPEYFIKSPPEKGKVSIRDVLKEGQDIVVQIEKEERGNKGAALTTFVSLAGRFLVLKPNKPKSGGVSRRITGEDREEIREALSTIDIPEGMSVIVRTAGIDRTAEELEWDLNNLFAVWEAIKKVVVAKESPFLIYQESNAVIRSLRDYLSNDIGEVLLDADDAYEQAKEFIESVMPHNAQKLKRYSDPVPLFTRYQIESQIETAYAHSVNLPSGGSIVIDITEALISIDINSARATKGADIETTAFNTNLEAADEIARQLRLRDLGGLIVIDFIDMHSSKNQREVENRLRAAVKADRARIQIGKISRFGLLEMSRQRLSPSLGESTHQTCPRCDGMGNFRSNESLALAILRVLGEEARKERTSKVIAQLPVDIATYLFNEKRDWVQKLEARHGTNFILVANPAFDTPKYEIRRVRDDQVELAENTGTSFELAESNETEAPTEWGGEKVQPEQPAVQVATPATPAPTPKRLAAPAAQPTGPRPGVFVRIWYWLFGEPDPEEIQRKAKEKQRLERKKRDAERRAKRNTERKKTEAKRRNSRNTDSSNRGPKKRGNQQARNDKPKARNTKQESKGKRSEEDGKPASQRKTQGNNRSAQGNNQPKSSSPNDNATDSQEAKSDADQPRKRRRRSRGRRRKKPTGEQQAAQQTKEQSADTKAGNAGNPGHQGSDERAKANGSTNRQESSSQPRDTRQSNAGTEPSDSAKKDAPQSSSPSAPSKRESGGARTRIAASERKSSDTGAAESNPPVAKVEPKPRPKPQPKREAPAAAGRDDGDTARMKALPDADSKKPSQSSAAASSAPAQDVPSAPKPQKPKAEDKPQLLPWETEVPKKSSDKTYTVWSSDD
ncbi:MAG: Rne/Rng family ribonuclease [Pseudomonadota bacterium]